jgi:MoaA/NifB/PqqE/SkfB family radical SAM enzyme
MSLQQGVSPGGGVAWGPGFHGPEEEAGLPFRWMSARGELRWGPSGEPGFLELEVFAPARDLSQVLTLEAGGATARFALVHGWSSLSFEVPADAASVGLRVSHVLSASHHPGDPRTLGLRVRTPRLHRDAARHRAVAASAANAERNTREMLAGRTELESTPVSLGIDIHGACNINPPCVYCDWDASKSLEGENVTRPFTVETLRGYGPFFEQVSQLVNCSIGEPFMKRDLPDILALADDHGSFLEMSTNGQILTEPQLAALLGRRIHLYVSLDAATAETYSRLRNARFDSVVKNVRRIVEAKGGRGHYPLVYLVFMPVRANLHELEAFVRLCADLEVDQLVLRPLNADSELDLRWDRGGYSFRYQDELVPLEERIRISGRAHELCRLLGVPFANQLDFGGATSGMFSELYEEGRREARAPLTAAAAPPKPSPSDAQPAVPPSLPVGGAEAEAAPALADAALSEKAWPLCTEPWKSYYIVRRGVLPCCYGNRPIATVEDGQAAWNGPELRSIRKALAHGRFPRYCLRTPSCPIVQKHRESVALPARERALAALYDVWFASNRLTGGLPRRVWRLLKGPFERGGSGAEAGR